MEHSLATYNRKALGGFMLTVTAHTVDNTVILSCQGRLVRGEESELLCAAVHHHGRDVVLDLAGVSVIDAAGIGALVSLQAAGIYLKLMKPTEPVRAVLRLTGLEAVFEIGEGKKDEELLVPRVVALEHLPDAPVANPR